MSEVYIEVPDPLKSEISEYTKNTISVREIEKLSNPHVTIKWGLETNNVEELIHVLGEFIPIRVMIGKTSMFMADDYREQDVVKLDVFGMSLIRMNRLLSTMKHASIYKTYNPHITLAYVKKFHAIKYIGHNTVIGKKFVVDNVMFETDTNLYRINTEGKYDILR